MVQALHCGAVAASQYGVAGQTRIVLGVIQVEVQAPAFGASPSALNDQVSE
jgi:hypothetical protein